ncbi:MAG: PAS domain S-box protein [Proteobacteria bacterium]|nr:PAS domain S-box protein [Pseudomonadota bacterium]
MDDCTIDLNSCFAVLEKAPYGVILTDSDGKLIYANPEFTHITGYTLLDVPTSKDWLNKAYPDAEYRKKVIDFWRQDVTQKGIDRIFRIVCKDGSVKEIEFRPFLLDDGRAVTILSDVTQQKRSEEDLKESERKFRILFEDSRDAIFMTTSEGKFINANKAFLDLFGYTRDGLAEITAGHTYFNPSERARFRAEIEAKGAVRDYEVMLRKKDGTVMHCLLTATTRRANDGTILCYQGIIRDISAQRQMEEAIKESETMYRSIFETTGSATIIIEENTIITMANREFETLSGYGRDEIEGKKSFAEFLDKEDVQKLSEYRQMRKITPDTAPRNYDFRFTDRFMNTKNVLLIIAMISGTKKSIGSLLDITEQKQFQKSLAKSFKTMRDIIESAPIGIFIVNKKGDVDFVNPEMLQISGSTREQFLSLNVFKLLGYQRIGLVDKMKRGLDGEFFRMDSVEYTSHFGKRTTIRNFIGIPFEETGEKKLLMFVEDITKQKFNELQLAHLATHDMLTGLPNRTLYFDRLKVALASAQRFRQQIAVMLFDLDKFKDVNDVLGHKVGDALLTIVGERVTGVLRQSDSLARMGGDEFLVLLTNMAQVSDADTIAKKILDVFHKPFDIENNTLYITTSIGVAIYPEDGHDGDTLIKCADIAMYEAKQSGRNAYRHYK